MRKIVVLAALVPSLALAQGVARSNAPRRATIMTLGVGATILAGQVYSQQEMTSTVIIDKVYVAIGVAGGGGAGATALTFSDGTNTCTATISCADNVANTPRLIVPTGACTFTRGAVVSVAAPTTTCTTSQPSFRTVTAAGVVYP